MKNQTPPTSEQELMLRAHSLAGQTLGDVASTLEVAVPENFKRHKGWSGQLIETYLGASAGSKPQQDFVELGIELKTLPLNARNEPIETTYVCYAPLTNITGITWQTSNVRNKLQCVLWIPVEGERDIAPANRMIGSPILWRPTLQQDTALRHDWEELMERIALGNIESVSARIGELMQLRPKAANGSVLTNAIGPNGQTIKTRPRGFYLRKEFTKQILQNAFS